MRRASAVFVRSSDRRSPASIPAGGDRAGTALVHACRLSHPMLKSCWPHVVRRYVYRAVDKYGQVSDVHVFPRRVRRGRAELDDPAPPPMSVSHRSGGGRSTPSSTTLAGRPFMAGDLAAPFTGSILRHP
jgi:hypothetical protein